MRRLAPAGLAALTFVLTLLMAALALALGGYDPIAAFSALFQGALGSADRFFSITLVRATPLILTGLGVALAFRAGIWNIGAEGQLYAGAVFGVWIALGFGHLPGGALLPVVLLSSAVAGGLWAVVPAIMRLRLGVSEVITTLLLNFVGIHLASWVVHGPLQESRGVFPQTDPISEAARLPQLLPGGRLHVGFSIAILLGVLLWLLLRYTAFGFQLRASGASPKASEISGRIPTGRVILGTFLISGAIAGLAGGVEVTGVTYALYEDLSPGYGYTAIAVAILAGLHPLGVLLTGILFGVLEGGASAMQREVGIPAVWVNGIEALMILMVLLVGRVGRRFQQRGA